MMENKNNSGGGLFSGLGGMGNQNNLQGLSPYLNIDTSYLQSTPEFLFDQETKRGKMEKSFSAIGSSVCIGSGLGGAYGIYDGVRQTALANLTVYEEDDEMKSLLSGTVTGAIFKSTAGVKKCARGAAIGLGLATLWAYGLKQQEHVANYM